MFGIVGLQEVGFVLKRIIDLKSFRKKSRCSKFEQFIETDHPTHCFNFVLDRFAVSEHANLILRYSGNEINLECRV
jgi:hypothetical protein